MGSSHAGALVVATYEDVRAGMVAGAQRPPGSRPSNARRFFLAAVTRVVLETRLKRSGADYRRRRTPGPFPPIPAQVPALRDGFAPTAAEAAAMHLDRAEAHRRRTNGGFFVAVFEKAQTTHPTPGALAPEDAQEVCVVEGATILPEALTRIADGAAEGGGGGDGEATAATEEGADAVPPTRTPMWGGGRGAKPAADGLGLDVMHMCTNLPKRQKEDNGEFVYQPLFVPPPDMVDEIATFFGIGDSFPLARLAARSVGALTLVLVGPEARELLAADGGGALRLVHTGVRCFERDVAKGTGAAHTACASRGCRCCCRI